MPNTEMYKLLHSDAKILFMSATPKLYGNDNGYNEDYDIDEEIFGNIDYKMQMHDAIATGKICDYMVYVPTLSIEKTFGLDKIQEEVNISEYDNELVKELVIKARFIIRGMMNNGGRRCIIYLQTKEECKKMNTILADVGKKYFAIDINSNYIISDLDKDERKFVLKEFVATGGYNFLCSVDILNECIDIPECDSIFIAYPSKSKIRNIQRVCRANRLDKKNIGKVAGIYVWADEYKDDLVDFLGHLKEYDGGFSFNKVRRLNVVGKRDAVMQVNDNVNENKSLEGLVVGVKGINSWMEKLEEVKKFIDDNGRRPNKTDNKYLNKWLSHQITNFNNQISYIKQTKIYKLWTDFVSDVRYKKYFENDKITIWINYLDLLQTYIDVNKKRPTPKTNKKLYAWMANQLNNDKKHIKLLKNQHIKEKWTDFINNGKYFKYFNKDNYKIWINRFNELINYIDKNNTFPKTKTNLSIWVNTQKKNYKYKTNIMKNNKEIYDKWTSFINNDKYKLYFMSNNELWIENFNELKKFIDTNNCRPNLKNNPKLYGWMQTQTNNFRKNIQIMKTDCNILALWVNFINESKYSIYYIDDETIWIENYNELIKFINKYEKRPQPTTHTKLYNWTRSQISNFKNEKYCKIFNKRYNLWLNLIQKYKILF